ncbi:MAG: hypothetical protein SGJ20_20850, partial [Planctomycetota bacterium]|nr:hypothetical protein [Planctomycetota bacterium]
MSIGSTDFWRMMVEGRLITTDESELLRAEYAETTSGNSDEAVRLAEWLIGQKRLSQYQARILLAGKGGRFVYGDYRIDDRISSGRLFGLYAATHLPTGHSVLLYSVPAATVELPRNNALLNSQVAAAVQAVHPCLSQTNQLVDFGKQKFVVMETLPGRSADELLADGKRVSIA